MADIADRNRDADLLKYVHKIAIGKLTVDRSKASLMVGRAIMAGIQMSKAQDRHDQMREYLAHRQVPIRDAQGRDHTISIREVEPRTLAQVITNRVTRPPEERFDPKDVRQRADEQLKQSQQEVKRALDFFNASNQIASDYCSKVGVRMEEIPPTLTAEQIQEIKEYLPRMQDEFLKREFSEALPRAERELKERERERAILQPGPERDQKCLQPDRPIASDTAQDREQFEPDRGRDSGFRGR